MSDKPAQLTPGLAAVGAAIDGAPRVGAKAKGKKISASRAEGEGRNLEVAHEGLPEDCPVVPLGIGDGCCHYLDASRQLVTLEASKHSRLGIQHLFGTKVPLLYDYWPRLKESKGEFITTGWRPELAAEKLMAAAAARGVWNPFEKIRGRGAHLGVDGELILHCGDRILVGAPPSDPTRAPQWYEPGMIGRHVYPAGESAPRPSPVPAVAGDHGAAAEVLSLFKSWNWYRGELDAMLLLGWIGSAMLGGAPEWRPMAWVTGGAGTGKSTIDKAVKRLLDDGGLISTTNATAAAIWQNLKFDSIPIWVDETEAKSDNRKSRGLIELAREAASGALIMRGGSDHQGSSFRLRSAFIFSSINIPPLSSQDRSRMAILELGQLQGITPPDLDPRHMRELGAALRRRMFDAWPRFNRIFARYRAELAAAGHVARGADQFGMLLTAAHVLLHDGEPDSDSEGIENAAYWAQQLNAGTLAETIDNERDEMRCAQFLLTTPVDLFRNGRRCSIGTWVARAAERDRAKIIEGQPVEDPDEANLMLVNLGIKVQHLNGVAYLAVANFHQGLAAIYAPSKWAGQDDTLGVWVQSWRRLAEAAGSDRQAKQVRYGGVVQRSTLVPVKHVLPDFCDDGKGFTEPVLPRNQLFNIQH